MIYFVHAPVLNCLKIGFAGDPWARLSKMQSDCPCSLELLAIIEGGQSEEAALHRKFALLRKRGEWFEYSGVLTEYVEALAPAQPKARRQAFFASISERSGISKSYISLIVNGKRRPPVEVMLHLFKTADWKHPALDTVEDSQLLSMADQFPWTPPKERQDEAA